MQVKQSSNILNWYPLTKEQDVLEIGTSVTSLFCRKCGSVTTVEPNVELLDNIVKEENLELLQEPVNKLKLDKQYDIITLIGWNKRTQELIGENIKLTEIIKMLERYLKPNGKILLAVDNKFGLRFFAGDPENVLNKKFRSLTGYKDESEKIETFTKSRLERKLHEIGYNTAFYYPLPDYRLANVIFSDRQLPNYTGIDKYHTYHLENSTIIMDELDVFREILKNDENMFTFFANSFLVEASKSNCEQKYKYISFNNLRKEEYQLITKIADTYVEKEVVSKKAEKHYQNIKDNLEVLEKNGINTVDYVENGIVKSKYIEQKYLLNNVLVDKLEAGKIQEFENIVDKYIKAIGRNSYKETDYSKTLFGAYNITAEDERIIEDMHFLKDGLWDMTFKNCFYKEDELYFFDQEWNKPNLPYEYILYRSILYTVSLRRFLKIEDLYEKYNLTKYLDLFKKLDDILQEEIRDENVWEFYNKNKYVDIDGTVQEVINLNIRSKAQQGAIDNLTAERDALKAQLEKKLTIKVRRKIKGIMKK